MTWNNRVSKNQGRSSLQCPWALKAHLGGTLHVEGQEMARPCGYAMKCSGATKTEINGYLPPSLSLSFFVYFFLCLCLAFFLSVSLALSVFTFFCSVVLSLSLSVSFFISSFLSFFRSLFYTHIPTLLKPDALWAVWCVRSESAFTF